MNDYGITDYGIFNDAVATTTSFCADLESDLEMFNYSKDTLSDAAVLMGPFQEECMSFFNSADNGIQAVVNDMAKVKQYLITASEKYKQGDKEASGVVVNLSSGTMGVPKTTGGVPQLVGSTNKDKIYNYLASQGLNKAAICGILANVFAESNYDANALGDNGTSYGICQWHNSRWQDLKNYCNANGLDSTTLEGQLSYLVSDLKNGYPNMYQQFQNLPNNQSGAYQAAYLWTVTYERPNKMEERANYRGGIAYDLWSKYQ